ncbi:SMI1/KNR4 family protein [Pyxidicoccus xibeiensis]|uniref:SMI1/KNR4 family protein n=1 Tax=Pyxidicoccus xibeiensis TaxID=2906759 RepID=UPI0020A7DAD7|nr:SMI1/KNR4 family protein [Pyxidicoccus xibeiensis]MCP3136626.1 SMI1/KNR4 family protein [Pyxidicoccus xibeiensis]
MTDALIAFIERFDPAFSSKLQGASDEEIARLEALVGRSLPPVYRDFLRRMGKGMGDFQVPRVSFDIERISGVYEDEDRPPARYQLVAVEEQDPYFDFYLDLEWASGPDFGVVRFESFGDLTQKTVSRWALSFHELLLALACLYKWLPTFPARTGLLLSSAKLTSMKQPGAALPQLLEQVATRLGFQKVPQSSRHCLLLERGDAAIFCEVSPRGGPFIEAAAADKAELARLSEILRDSLPLV